MKKLEDISSAAIWGLWGLLATIVTAGLLSWSEDRILAIMLLCASGILLTAIIVVTIYRPLRSLVRRVETIHEYFGEILARPERRVTWNDFLMMVVQLTCQVSSHSFDPELVIGVGRGGAIVAGLVAGYLGNKPVLVVDTDWTSVERPLLPHACKALDMLKAGTKVLCVEADQDTGTSFRQVSKMLSQASVDYRLGTLWHRSGRADHPDFCVVSSEEKPHWPFRIGRFRAR